MAAAGVNPAGVLVRRMEQRSAVMLYRMVRPLLFRLDPEVAHHETLRLGRALERHATLLRLLSAYAVVDHPALRTSAFGRTFRGPLGVAAGFDKNADLLRLLPALGFGFLEVGTATPRPWLGNPPPRLFRLPEDLALVNRMGLNNLGAAEVGRRVRAASGMVPVGINLGRVDDGEAPDPVADFADAEHRLDGAGDYLAVNVSCPNTGDGRTFEDPGALRRLLRALRRRPRLVKLSPDLSDTETLHLVDVALEAGVDGFILTNTTVARDGLRTPKLIVGGIGHGGLSGAPLAERARARLRMVHRYAGRAVPLIGVGGIFNAADAYARIRAGASLLQVYTGMIYQGPFIAREIHRGLLRLMGRDGVARLADVVGAEG